jgi:hypothetical protein
VKISAVGLPWYRKGHYAQLRSAFADGSNLHSTYAEWLAAARATEAHLLARGHRAVRVHIEPSVFFDWCIAEGIAPDAAARIRYASEVASIDHRLAAAHREVYQRARTTTDAIERHVTAIFTHRDDGRLDFEGSGLFARLENRYYIITAAHVLDACESGCFVRGAQQTGQALYGTRVVTGRPVGKTRDDDKFDIGFIRLSEDEVEGIGATAFLDLTYTVDGPPAEPVEVIVAVGFAARDQTVENETVRTKLTMFTTGPESEHAYRLAKADPRSHLLVRYKRKGMHFNGEYYGSAPSLTGLSGGGLWQVHLQQEVRVDTPPALAALIVEQPATYQTSIFATRAPLVREFVRRFDNVPSS